MKNILLFKAFESLFAEKRLARMAGPNDAQESAKDTPDDVVVLKDVIIKLRKDRDSLKTQIDAVKSGKIYQNLSRIDASQKGIKDAQTEISARQEVIAEIQKKNNELRSHLEGLKRRIDLIRDSGLESAADAKEVEKKGTLKNTFYVAKCDTLEKKIALLKEDVIDLNTRKENASGTDATDIERQIGEKENEIAKLNKELEISRPAKVASNLNQKALGIGSVIDGLQKEYDDLSKDLVIIKGIEEDLLSENTKTLGETPAGTAVAKVEAAHQKSTEEVRAATAAILDREAQGLKIQKERHDEAVAYVKEKYPNEPLDDAKVAAREAELKLKDEEREKNVERKMKEEIKMAPDKRSDLYMKIEQNKVSADALKIDSKENLVTTVLIFKDKLGLDEEIVNKMAERLSYANSEAFEQKYNKDGKGMDTKEYKAFKTPTIDNLGLLQRENEEFYLAALWFLNVKNTVAEVNNEQINYKERKSVSGEEPAFTFATENVQKVGRDFANAWHEKDYSKLAMYGVAAYGIYKFYEHFLSKPDENTSTGKFLKGLKTWGPMLAGAYAAGWLVYPEGMKKMVGMGKNIDFTGTDVEGAAEVQRNAPKGSYLENLDPTTLFTLKNASVEDVFAPITPTRGGEYNDEFAQQNMIPLASPGIAGYFEPDLVGQGSYGASFLSQNEKLTVKQQLYRDSSKKLYATAIALRDWYKDKLEPTTKVSFDDMFLNNKPGNGNYRPGYTIGALLTMFKDYLPAKSRIYEASDFKQADKDLKNNGAFTKAFNDAGLSIESNRAAGATIAAEIYGQPVSITRQYAADGKTSKYVFFLAGRGDKLDEKVEYTTGQDSEFAAGEIKGKIEKRFKDYMNGADFVVDGAKAPLEYNGGKWFFKVKTAPQHLIQSNEGIVNISSDKSGKISIQYEGKDVTVLTGNDLPFKDKSLVVDMFGTMEITDPADPTKKIIVGKSNFDQLRSVSDQISISENRPDLGTFNITVFNVTATINSKNHRYEMTPEDQKKFIDSEQFRSSYAESRIKAPVYANKIAKIKATIEDLNSRFTAAKVTGSLGNFIEVLKGNVPLSGVLNGSIPETYLAMQLAAQTQLVKNDIENGIAQSTDFATMRANEVSAEHRFSKLSAFAASISRLPARALSQHEIRSLVIDPLRGLTSNTVIYASELRNFEKDVILPNLNVSDLSSEGIEKASQLHNVFFHYTVEFDQADLDKAINPLMDSGSDLRLQKRKYIEYVRGQIAMKADQFLETGKPTATPDDSAWEIQHFNEWIADPVNTPDALSEIPMDATEIENEIAVKCENIVRKYEDEGHEYASAVRVIFEAHRNSPGDQFKNKSGDISRAGLQNRTLQNVQIDVYVKEFAQTCEEGIDAAIKQDLKNKPGWPGSIERWFNDKFNIHF